MIVFIFPHILVVNKIIVNIIRILYLSFRRNLCTCQQTGWSAGRLKDTYATGIPTGQYDKIFKLHNMSCTS